MPASILEQSCSDSRRRDEPESGPKLRIRHENTNSRRFLAPNSKNFIENEMSCRSNVTISSTVSSPGYFVRDEIDPSTYSFTTALKALQARSNYSSSSEGLSLNSKWSDAEKYICNPLSGEVPLECLSAKTLSSRSFSSRITMSAPLINYPPHKPTLINPHHHNHLKFTLQEKTKIGTRDVGIQSTLDDVISSDSSSFSPSTEETSRKETEEEETGDSSVSSGKQKPQTEVEVREKEEGRERKKVMMMWRCEGGEGGRRRGGGCGLSLKGLWQRDKSKSRHNTSSSPTFHYHINACFNEY